MGAEKTKSWGEHILGRTKQKAKDMGVERRKEILL